jgi:hypothetical protein
VQAVYEYFPIGKVFHQPHKGGQKFAYRASAFAVRAARRTRLIVNPRRLGVLALNLLLEASQTLFMLRKVCNIFSGVRCVALLMLKHGDLACTN